MTSDSHRSAFEKLKQKFDEDDLKCEECGHLDEEGEWETSMDGSTIRYEHECPSCGATMTRTIERE